MRSTAGTLFVIICSLTLAAQAAAQQADQSYGASGEDFAAVYSNLKSIPQRFEGSPAEKQAVEFITEYLQSNGIPYTVSDLGQLSGAHSYSTSI
ncbi:MAG: hypothetical protein JW852_02825, partial [Spirochaetales bacterium]|nr:hypothetical protein [Spirochaetales bacterium]